MNIKLLFQKICYYSIWMALKEQKLLKWIVKLRTIVPDISEQESRQKFGHEKFWELKRRGLHSFQCGFMLRALDGLKKKDILVVDIGDSAGTHMSYLKEIAKDTWNVDTVSVNLDHRAIKKIRDRKLKAVLKRAEEIESEDLGGKDRDVDLFTSFEMVEHLHNPVIFFKRLAYKRSCNRILLTVPYIKKSRVGLHHIRKHLKEIVYAEDEHIFELNPQDWELIFKHSGWKVVFDKIYYQYPKKIPILSQILCLFWRKFDYEGFWGVLLLKDKTYSDLYMDWEN